MDDTAPGARSRNISGLFVENAMGERFKYPFIHLEGARAMQRHVANGGVPYDEIGKSIVGMSEEIAQLKSFGNYVVRNDLMNSDTNSVVERSTNYLNSLREQIKALTKQKHYEAYRENFQAYSSEEVPQDVVEDFTEKFTVKNFKEDIKNVFPVLYRLMKEGNTIGYDDIVALTQEEMQNEDVGVEQETYDPFSQFENWVMGLGETSAITSEDPDEAQAALQQLQELVSQEFPAGTDGTNAIESLKGIIEDSELFNRIKEMSREDANIDVREQIQGWLQLNAPEILEQLDFGDMGVEEPMPAEVPAPEQVPQEAADSDRDDDKSPPWDTDDDEKSNFKKPDNPNRTGQDSARALAQKGMQSKMNVQELAEFIHSFYDRDSGTFPKGPEGVAIMVGKKFGEQAEMVARKMVERMAPQQQDPQIAELARIRELSGY
jgi:hypothetical protein